MPTVETDEGAYQSLERIRQRVDYEGGSLFSDNEQLRFDELLVELERESRGIFETHWGDETPLEETDRTDEIRCTDDAAMPLAYPIKEVTKVERKTSMSGEWRVLDPNWYDFTKHRLVLARRPNNQSMQGRGNRLTRDARRTTWRGLASKIRVTYDRGFGSEPPADILSIQIQIINQMLRGLKREQTVAAASPEEFAGQTETNEVLTDEIRNRIDDVTAPGMASFSI